MSAHAQLSPSKAVRWMACPGSIREESKYPPEPSGPHAIDGTHSHTLLEHCLKHRPHEYPVDLIGTELEDHEGKFVVDANRFARIKVALEYIYGRVNAFGGICSIKSECKVSPKHLVGRDDMDGTCDVQLHAPMVLEIVDYKDGMNPVPAEDNPQLEQYVLGVLSAFELPVNGNYPFQTVRMTIIQPKLALRNINPVIWHEVTLEQMLSKIGKFAAAAKATDDPEAPLVPGEVQCKYCRAKGSCSALAQQAIGSVGMMFPVVGGAEPASPLDLAQQSASQDPNEMSNERLSQIIEAAPLVRQMLDAAEAEALKRMQAGQEVPGLKLVNGRGSRSWSLTDDEMAEKLVKMGVPKSAVYVTKVVSPAQVSKLQWSKRDGTTKSLSERQLKTIDTEYIVTSKGKITVAPLSDPRQAITTNAAPLFSAVESAVESPVAELPDWLK